VSERSTIEQFLSQLRRADVYITVRGDRLVVDAPEGTLTDDLRARIAARKDEILQFLAEAVDSDGEVIVATPGSEPILSFAQQRMWFLDQLQKGTSAFNSPMQVRFRGPLNVEALAQGVAEIHRRHDVLRMSFPVRDGKPVARIRPPSPIDLPLIDCSGATANERARIRHEHARAIATAPFDLAIDDLVRMELLRLEENDHLFLFTMHHIVSDGWSIGLFLHELSDLYKIFDQGRPERLPGLQLQYADFARWQATTLAKTKHARDLAYWRSILKGAPDLLSLPTDRPRPAIYRFEGGKVPFTIGQDQTNDLRRLCEQEGVTAFMVLLAAYSAVLSKMSGLKDIVVGYPIAGRRHNQLESIIGCFVNTLLLRCELTDDLTFRQLIAHVRTASSQAYEHQDLPFEKLVDEVQPERNLSHNPLFQVAFVFQNVPFGLPDFPGMEVLPRDDEQFTPGATFDMTLVMEEVEDALRGELEYNRVLFDHETAQRVAAVFTALLDAAIREPDQSVLRLEVLDPSTRRDLIWGRNKTGVDYPKTTTVSRLFESVVEETPDVVAIECDDATVTYRELNERSNRLARWLQSRGAGRGTIVGVMVKHSVDLLVGLLGVMKSGAAYLPIDPSHPAGRVGGIIQDANLQLLLTPRELIADLTQIAPDVHILDVADAAVAEVAADNLNNQIQTSDVAYVIYTSGSSGRPKGVVVEHGALTNYIWWARQQYLAGDKLDFALHTSVAFDLTVTSLYVPLISGSRLVVYGESGEHRVPPILRIVQEGTADIVKLTPSHLALLRDLDLKDSRVRKLVVGGENLRTELARRIHDVFGGNIEIYNEYGPTEATVGCMIHRYDPEQDTATSVPIGVPADNLRIYLLGDDYEPVPAGAIGEMYIAGDGVARGYLHQEELTRERFLPDPFVQGARMYRTGDLARWRNEHVMEYHGRTDHQVKIRGHRVELGEIETQICTHAGVRECVVNVAQTGLTSQDEGELEHCVECGLPSNYPGTTFDEQGRCNQCTAYERYRRKVEPYFKDIGKFEAIFNATRQARQGEYDCIVLLSGGKDSTYVLARLVDMGLDVLAYTLDNGYISDQAKENIRRVVEALGVDHIFGTTPHMPAIFADSLARHSNVCNGCFKALYTLSMSLARQKRIPCIVTGLSRGQQFETRLSNFYRADDFCVDTVDRSITEARKVYHRLDDEVSRRLDVEIFRDESIFDEIQILDFYRYCDVSLDEMYSYLDTRVPWVRPSDTGRSTNCTINDVGIYIHKKQRKYHNYAMPYAWDVRMGHKQRDAALQELDDEIDVDAVRQMLTEVGYDERQHSTRRTQDVLVAYFVGDGAVAEEELRAHLGHRLPVAMIPAVFVPVDEIPLTPNGKVDNTALAQISITRTGTDLDYVPPRTSVEQQLVSIWADILGLHRISVQDSFFRLGGHSLLAAQVVSRIAQDLHVELPVATLFDHVTIEELAIAIDESRSVLGVDDADVEDILAEVEAMTDEEALGQLQPPSQGAQESR